jgi:phosphatidylserine/phosphatidylglycerophosphate/cardiolipin synthase-like enzyme
MSRTIAIRLSALSLLLAACGGIGTTADEANEIPWAEGSPEAQAVLAVANDRSLGVEQFDVDVALDGRAAKNIVKHRDGDPATADDDNPFDNLAELYAVPYCKKQCLVSILDYAKATGVYNPGSAGNVSVVFSPQTMDNSHLARVAKMIDGAKESVDIAMYSYSNSGPVRDALKAAMDRGVKIRFLADTDLAAAASKGGALEDMGIDVRRVTKIMHHKFCIIDGPRDNASLDHAATARISSGSGNWSTSAATTYDENTLFIDGGEPELALRLQRDFDTLWAGSKDQVFNSALQWDQTHADITDDLIAQNDDPNADVLFTSVNFKPTSGQGWSYLGTSAVTDKLVQAIHGAKTSIEIASAHLASVPIAQAVDDALAANPDLSVQIALDCQESSRGDQIYDLKADIEKRGGSIYYKCNTYRWHYMYAEQLHDKYIVLDGTTLYSGSMNLSDNAEDNTFENVFMFTGEPYAGLIAAYHDNFQNVVRAYGRADNLKALEDLRNSITTGSYVPLTWSQALSIDLATFTDLKNLIRQQCPAASGTSPEAQTYDKWFNTNPAWFTKCEKSGYPWPNVPADKRL